MQLRETKEFSCEIPIPVLFTYIVFIDREREIFLCDFGLL